MADSPAHGLAPERDHFMASPPAPDPRQQDIYHQAWQPGEYLQQYYATAEVAEDERINATLLSQWLRSAGRTFERALEFGCGPTIHHAALLAPFVKEHYLGFVGATFPALLPRYQRAYAGTNATPAYLSALDARVDRIREKYRFAEDSMRYRRIVPNATAVADSPAGSRRAQLRLPM